MATTNRLTFKTNNGDYFPTQEEVDFFELADSDDPPSSQAEPDLAQRTAQLFQATPSPVKKTETMLSKTTPDRSAVGSEKQLLQRLENVLTDDQHKEPLQKIRKRLFTSIADDFLPRVQGVAVSSIDQTTRHLISVHNIEDCFEACWIEDLLKILKRAGLNVAVINSGHITAPQIKHKTSGFHFCPVGHPHQKHITRTYQSAYSEVWYAEFDVGQGVKKSSFFPLWIKSEQQLLEIFANAQKLYVHKNRALFKANISNLFYFEVFYRDDIYIVSAFPIYYFAPYADGATIHLTPSFSVSMREINQRLALLKPEEHAQLVRYTFTEGRISHTILDVASLINGNPIEQGVYVQFQTENPKNRPA